MDMDPTWIWTPPEPYLDLNSNWTWTPHSHPPGPYLDLDLTWTHLDRSPGMGSKYAGYDLQPPVTAAYREATIGDIYNTIHRYNY